MDTQKLTWLQEFSAAAAAGTSACFFTNPVEVIKTRLQIQGELARSASAQRPFSNPLQAFSKIAQNEGVRGLQAGLFPAICYQITMNGIRLGTYSSIKTLFSANDPNDPYFFPKSVAAGAVCGTIGGCTGNPFFLVKVRMQNFARDPSLQVGFQHKYSNSFEAFACILKEEGIKGMLRGIEAQILRVSVASAVQLGVYDSIKHFLSSHSLVTSSKDSSILPIAASALTGFFVTVSMNPFDLVATRLYNQQVLNGKGVLYSGPIDCLIKTVRTEGVLALYKGFVPHYLRLTPHTILTLVFWEKYKSLAQKF